LEADVFGFFGGFEEVEVEAEAEAKKLHSSPMEADVETSCLLAFELEHCVSSFEAVISSFRFTDARAVSRRWTNDRRF
jgi:hypothetical protein